MPSKAYSRLPVKMRPRSQAVTLATEFPTRIHLWTALSAAVALSLGVLTSFGNKNNSILNGEDSSSLAVQLPPPTSAVIDVVYSQALIKVPTTSDLSLEDCVAAAKEETAPPLSIGDVWRAARVATCVADAETTKLIQAQLVHPHSVASAQEGRLILARANKLGLAELSSVRAAPNARVATMTRLAYRWIGDNIQSTAGKTAGEIATLASTAAEKAYKAGQRPLEFNAVKYHEALGLRTLPLTKEQILDVAAVCQAEADIIPIDGVASCAADIFNRLANGSFGSLQLVLNSGDFESIQRFGGLDKMPAATKVSIDEVMGVVGRNVANPTYGASTFFFDYPVVVNQRGTNAWISSTKIGVVGQAGVAWRSHDLHCGIVIHGVLNLYEVQEYKIIIVNGRPQRPTTPTLVTAIKFPAAVHE